MEHQKGCIMGAYQAFVKNDLFGQIRCKQKPLNKSLNGLYIMFSIG